MKRRMTKFINYVSPGCIRVPSRYCYKLLCGTPYLSGPVFFNTFFDTGTALSKLAKDGSCLLMYSSKNDQLIPFNRQEKLFASFKEETSKNCSIFNANEYQVHDRSPWADDHFSHNLEKFIAQV